MDTLERMAFDEFLEKLPKRLSEFGRRIADGLTVCAAARELGFSKYEREHATRDLRAAVIAAGFADNMDTATGRHRPKKKVWAMPKPHFLGHVRANELRSLLPGYRNFSPGDLACGRG